MDKLYQQLETKLGLGKIKQDEPLSSHTTFQIGGQADYYFEVVTTNELVKAIKTAKHLQIPYFVLGGGSNILVGDKGFRGLVIKNKSKELKILSYSGEVINQKDARNDRNLRQTSGLKINNILVKADSGVLFNQLVRFTIEEGLGGLEEFLGLPGTVGGAVSGNAHWQNKLVNDYIISKKYADNILLSVVFKLTKADKNSLWQKAKRAVDYRQKSQPTYPSAGCIFKNIKKSQAARLGLPDLTTSAGFLIEAAGLKGTRIGNVQISPLHANFIINLGYGKASDVIKLISLVKKTVKEKFTIDLQEEIIKIGVF